MVLRRRRQAIRPHARLRVEALESRTVPAGNVIALLLGGDLLVIGDGAGNEVEVTVTEGNLVVRGREGTDTTVNGGTGTVFEGVGGVADDLLVFLGRGDDRVEVRGVNIGDDVLIETGGVAFLGFGGDDDEVRLDLLTIGGGLTVSTGNGADALVLERSRVAGPTNILTGSGNDRFSLADATVNGRLTVETGAGADRVFLDPTAVGERVRIDTGLGADLVLLHGVNVYPDEVSLDGGRGNDELEIDEAADFAVGFRARGFESVALVPVAEFSPAEGLRFRNLPAGNPPGTGATDFVLNGARFSGGEVTFQALGAAYASAPAAYVPGPDGATVAFAAPVERARVFFTHLPGDAPGTITAFDEDGNAIATASSNEATFLGDPGNFVTLGGDRRIARLVVEGGMIDNLSFVG